MKFRFLIPLLIMIALLATACTAATPAPEAEQLPATETAPAEPPPEPTAAPSQGLPDEILNVTWEWTTLKDQSAGTQTDVPNPEKYTITFREDGTAEIKADCNNVLAMYSTEAGGLTLSLGPTTMVFCGEESLDTEYLQLLEMVAAGGPDGAGGLALETAGGAQRMEFREGDSEAATGTGSFADVLNIPWQWTALIETQPAAQSVVPNPENYTITFLPNGIFNFQADCNVGSGNFEVTDSSITLTLGPTTLAECGDESLYDLYLQTLGDVGAYELRGDQLALLLQDGAGEMQFSAGTTASGPKPAELVFFDDFRTDTGWFLSEGEDVSFELLNNGYQVTNNLINAQIWSVRSVQPNDIIQIVEAKRVEGPEDGYYGVVCRQQEGGRDYYALVIGSNGFYGIGIMVEGQFSFLTSGTDSSGIIDTQEGAFNQVRGDCLGQTLTVYANDQLLASIQDSTYQSGQIGMFTSTQMDPGLVVLFDTYTVLTP